MLLPRDINALQPTGESREDVDHEDREDLAASRGLLRETGTSLYGRQHRKR